MILLLLESSSAAVNSGIEDEVATADTAAVVGEGSDDSQGEGLLGSKETTGRVEFKEGGISSFCSEFSASSASVI